MNWYKLTIAAVVMDENGQETVVDNNEIDNTIERQFTTKAPQQRRVKNRWDYDEAVKPTITIRSLFFSYVVPTTQKMYPQFPMEHFSLEAFTNMSRGETGLDNRRRDRDPVFMKAGTEIKTLTDKCLSDFGTNNFQSSVNALVQRLHKWYYDESPSGELIQRKNKRQFDYKKLHDIGIPITPEQGKLVSTYSHDNPGSQKVRDEFIGAMNSLDDDNDEPIKQWWKNYGALLPKVDSAVSLPVVKSPPVKRNSPRYDEVYDNFFRKWIKKRVA